MRTRHFLNCRTASNEPQATETIPRLRNGDRLNRFEFARRYDADPDVTRAELIEGIVYVSSPVSLTHHAQPNSELVTWLGVFAASTAGAVRGGDNATVRFDLDNDVQPDALLRYVANGTSRVIAGYVQGPPELVVEIAASSASMDTHVKKNVYRRNGVQEYIVWRTEDGALDWFVLEEGEYVALIPDANGILSSRVFLGLRLDVAKLLFGDLKGVLDEQMRG